MAQSMYMREEKVAELEELCRLYKEIVEDNNCICLKDLAVTGSDLIGAGITPGKQIGEILNELLEIVLEDPELNTRDYLLEKALEHVKKSTDLK